MKLSYVDLFDYFVPGNAFAISSDEKIRLEVNESLRKICGKVQSEYTKALRTRRKEELDSKKKRFHIFEGQTESVQELCQEIDIIKDEMEEWRKSYSNLQEEICLLFTKQPIEYRQGHC